MSPKQIILPLPTPRHPLLLPQFSPTSLLLLFLEPHRRLFPFRLRAARRYRQQPKLLPLILITFPLSFLLSF